MGLGALEPPQKRPEVAGHLLYGDATAALMPRPAAPSRSSMPSSCSVVSPWRVLGGCCGAGRGCHPGGPTVPVAGAEAATLPPIVLITGGGGGGRNTHTQPPWAAVSGGSVSPKKHLSPPGIATPGAWGGRGASPALPPRPRSAGRAAPGGLPAAGGVRADGSAPHRLRKVSLRARARIQPWDLPKK